MVVGKGEIVWWWWCGNTDADADVDSDADADVYMCVNAVGVFFVLLGCGGHLDEV